LLLPLIAAGVLNPLPPPWPRLHGCAGAAQLQQLLQRAGPPDENRVRREAQVEHEQPLLVGLEDARQRDHGAAAGGAHGGNRLPQAVDLS
jgi:hypothetical protein